MNLLNVLVRTVKRYPRLRKAEPADFAKRQGSQMDFALSIVEEVALFLKDVVLRKEKSADPIIGNAPGFNDLHVVHPVSKSIITEKGVFCKEKKLHAVSYHFVRFGTRSDKE